MAINKVALTINSRQYTVIAEENTEYIERLGNHINEKVETVIRGGQNVMGERPVVLAALNICDEYFKSLEAGEVYKEQAKRQSEKNLKLQHALKDLQREVEMLKNGQMSIDETAMKAEVTSAKNELEDANNKIKFLEGHITGLESKLKILEAKYAEREKEILEMIEKS